MEWRDARDALLDRRGGLDVLLDALAAGGEEALAAARLEIHPHLDSGSPPLSDLWDVEKGSGRPRETCWRWSGAAARCCAWLAIMTGRAQEDGGWPGGEHPGLWREVQATALARDKRCLLGRFD